MKKILIALSLVLLVGVGSAFAYADSPMGNGYISEEEAKDWEEHFEDMDEFHRENGFGPCHGGGMGMMRGGFNRGRNGSGMGMRMGW